MIPHLSLTDSLAADLRDALIAAAPITGFPADAVRLPQETATQPARRIVITAGDSQRVQAMDLTARIPITIEYIAPMDDNTPDAHRAAAAQLDTWLRTLAAEKRRDLLHSRTFLHDLYTLQPLTSRPTDDREATTTIRAEAIVTLAETE